MIAAVRPDTENIDECASRDARKTSGTCCLSPHDMNQGGSCLCKATSFLVVT